jgi:hypothetical protein
MIWKDITDYNNEYKISEYGDVYSYKSKKILKPSKDGRGYLGLTLCFQGKPRSFRVHVLVAKYFIGPRPNGYNTNHKDTNKTNNHYTNLEYLTPKENSRHAVKNGIVFNTGDHCRGELCVTAKLTERDIRWIRLSSRKVEELSDEYHVSKSCIRAIRKNQTWKHVI